MSAENSRRPNKQVTAPKHMLILKLAIQVYSVHGEPEYNKNVGSLLTGLRECFNIQEDQHKWQY